MALPEYKLLSVEEPIVLPSDNISQAENLVYNIEIDSEFNEDSLHLLQDYFIQKGANDFKGVNKIIVRAYLKGTSVHGTPYASLNSIGGNSEIFINDEKDETMEHDDARSNDATPYHGTALVKV